MGPGRVIILGGGLAGMAAALRLSESGFEVELYEKRGVLGGRASSFVPPGETAAIDNCQHVLLGCCTNLIDFYRRTGALERIRYSSTYRFLGPHGLSTVSASVLPAPLHLLPSFVRFLDLDSRDRFAIVSAMISILRNPLPPSDEPLTAWLARHRQTPGAIENFWRVVLTSALNEDIEHLAARPAVQVFWEAFLRNRKGYRIGVPAVSLSELYSSGILGARCALRLATPVTCINLSAEGVQGICLQSGEVRSADYYISALPHDSLLNLVASEQRNLWPEMESWNALEWSPITGIHLWFDRPVFLHEHAAVLGRAIQWIFNKSASGSCGEGQYIELVISASRSLMTKRRDEVLTLVLGELREILPATSQAVLRKSVVVREAKSTFSYRPGSEQKRAGAKTPFRNLFLAGDWTATGWPPTMEGAVRSGYRAAECVTEAAGKPLRFLVPDLPSDPLVRFLAGPK